MCALLETIRYQDFCIHPSVSLTRELNSTDKKIHPTIFLGNLSIRRRESLGTFPSYVSNRPGTSGDELFFALYSLPRFHLMTSPNPVSRFHRRGIGTTSSDPVSNFQSLPQLLHIGALHHQRLTRLSVLVARIWAARISYNVICK